MQKLKSWTAGEPGLLRGNEHLISTCIFLIERVDLILTSMLGWWNQIVSSRCNFTYESVPYRTGPVVPTSCAPAYDTGTVLGVTVTWLMWSPVCEVCLHWSEQWGKILDDFTTSECLSFHIIPFTSIQSNGKLFVCILNTITICYTKRETSTVIILVSTTFIQRTEK